MLTFSDIARLFEEIELKLISSLKRNLLGHKAWEKIEGFKWSAWQAEKLKNIEKFRRENHKIMQEYRSVIDDETHELMEQEFEEGELLVEQQLKKLQVEIPNAEKSDMVTSDNFFGVNAPKMESLMQDITQLEQRSETSALRMIDDVYRQTLNKVQLEMGIGATTLPKAIDNAVEDFLAQGINSITYSNGRRVNIADYVRMALRATATRATLQGKAKRFAELGYDTVIVSQYGMCSDTCLPWQGEIYIDDVFTVWNGEMDGKQGKSNYCDKWFTLLSVALRGGLFHPNCRHTMSVWIEGVSKKPMPLDENKIKEQAKLEQKQRAMERNIRRHKRLVLGCSDPENIKRHKTNLKQTQQQLNAFVKEHHDILRRDYSREKVYEGEIKSAPTNYARASDIFTDYTTSDNVNVTAEQIVENLKSSEIGKEYLEYSKNLPERIKLDYETDAPELYGEQQGDSIIIYMRSNTTAERAARTVIHECTHYRYGIGESQWAESVCISHELMHKYNRRVLTITEKKRIIKAVKEAYSDKNWRKGGIINGRRKNY